MSETNSQSPARPGQVKISHTIGSPIAQSTLSGGQTMLSCQSGQIKKMAKSSAVVKIDERDFERIPTLTDREMLRILDARSEDIGQGRIMQPDCTAERYAALLSQFNPESQRVKPTISKHDISDSGMIQRFRDYCNSNCVNGKLKLVGFGLGIESAREIASILAVKTDIVHINLSKNNLRDEGVDEILRKVRISNSIIHVDLSQNNLTTKGSKMAFKNMIGHNSIISLNVGNEGNTQKNKIGEQAVPRIVEFLQKSSILQFLNLRSTVLGDQGITLLSEGLKDSKSLFYLNVAKNDLTACGMEALAKVLVSTEIVELDVSFNPLGNAGITELTGALTDKYRKVGTRTFRNLTKLNLSECSFQQAGAYKLFKAMVDYRSIETLILDGNFFTGKANKKMDTFKEALCNSRLQTLSINNCKLGEQGGIAIGEAIKFENTGKKAEKTDQHIKNIYARHNQFKDETAKSIAEGIKSKTCLVHKLDLSRNGINDAGGELIAEALAENNFLQYLNLSHNGLRVSSGAMFVQSLKTNDSIKYLKLNDNCITNDFIRAINQAVYKNQAHFEINNLPKLRWQRDADCQNLKTEKVDVLKETIESKIVLQVDMAEQQQIQMDIDKILKQNEYDERQIEQTKQEHRAKIEAYDKKIQDEYNEEIFRQKETQLARKYHRRAINLENRRLNNASDLSISKEHLNEVQEDQERQKYELYFEIDKYEKAAKQAKQAYQKLKDEYEMALEMGKS